MVWRTNGEGKHGARRWLSAVRQWGGYFARTGHSTWHFPAIPPATRPESPLSHSAQGLQQGACLKEAQLYLSGWKVHSRGRAAWDPQHQTSSSTRGRGSVPGPSGGLLLHPETRSRGITVTPLCLHSPGPSSSRQPRWFALLYREPRASPSCQAGLSHEQGDKLSGCRTLRMTTTGPEASVLILEMGRTHTGKERVKHQTPLHDSSPPGRWQNGLSSPTVKRSLEGRSAQWQPRSRHQGHHLSRDQKGTRVKQKHLKGGKVTVVEDTAQLEASPDSLKSPCHPSAFP